MTKQHNIIGSEALNHQEKTKITLHPRFGGGTAELPLRALRTDHGDTMLTRRGRLTVAQILLIAFVTLAIAACTVQAFQWGYHAF